MSNVQIYLAMIATIYAAYEVRYVLKKNRAHSMMSMLSKLLVDILSKYHAEGKVSEAYIWECKSAVKGTLSYVKRNLRPKDAEDFLEMLEFTLVKLKEVTIETVEPTL